MANKSGRVWKTAQAERTSAMVKNNASKLGWEKRQQRVLQDRITKKIERERAQEKLLIKQQKEQDLKERRLRKEENERKAEIVQKISAGLFER